MSKSKYDEILEKLEDMFPNKLLLSVSDLSQATGLKKRTIYNATGGKASKKFPVRPVRHSRLLKFRIHDVARFISTL